MVTAEKTTAEKRVPLKIDIDKLVKKAQDSYDKKDKGLSKQLSTR